MENKKEVSPTQEEIYQMILFNFTDNLKIFFNLTAKEIPFLQVGDEFG